MSDYEIREIKEKKYFITPQKTFCQPEVISDLVAAKQQARDEAERYGYYTYVIPLRGNNYLIVSASNCWAIFGKDPRKIACFIVEKIEREQRGERQ